MLAAGRNVQMQADVWFQGWQVAGSEGERNWRLSDEGEGQLRALRQTSHAAINDGERSWCWSVVLLWDYSYVDPP